MQTIYNILALIGAVGVLWGAFRKRLPRLWKPGYVIEYVEAHPESGLTVTLIADNAGIGYGRMTLKARRSHLLRPYGQLEWRVALFTPQDADAAALVFNEGLSRHRVHLRLISFADKESEDLAGTPLANREQEQEIVRSIVGMGLDDLEFRLRINGAEVKLLGRSSDYPVAKEAFNRDRIRRLF